MGVGSVSTSNPVPILGEYILSGSIGWFPVFNPYVTASTAGGNEGDVLLSVQLPFSLTRLRVTQLAAGAGGANANVVTLRRNGADTALTASRNDNAVAQTTASASATVSFAAGDTISLRVDPGSAFCTARIGWCLQ